MTEKKSKAKVHAFPETREVLVDLDYNDMYIKMTPEKAHDFALSLLSAAAKAKGEIVHRLILDLPMDE